MEKRLEKKRLGEIDAELQKLRHLLEGLMPIHMQVDRKVKHLELRIKFLENERLELSQGQLRIDVDF